MAPCGLLDRIQLFGENCCLQLQYTLFYLFRRWRQQVFFRRRFYFSCQNTRRHIPDGEKTGNRPGMAQRVPGGLDSHISMTFGTWSWWRQPHAPAVFTPRNVPGTHFHSGLIRPQDHGTVGRNMSLKNPVTTPGIDPGIVRLVLQRLNHYATPGPTVTPPILNCSSTQLWVVKFCIVLLYPSTVLRNYFEAGWAPDVVTRWAPYVVIEWAPRGGQYLATEQ